MSIPPACAISVIIPVRNQERELPSFSRDLERGLTRLGAAAEIIFVDNGSTDRTADALQALAATDPRVVAVILTSSFDHTASCVAGIAQSRGTNVFVMSSLRDDFELNVRELSTAVGATSPVVFARKLRAADSPLLHRFGLSAPISLFPAGQLVACSTAVRAALLSFRRESGRLPISFAELGFATTNLGRPGFAHEPAPRGPSDYVLPVAGVCVLFTLFALLATIGALALQLSPLAFVLSTWGSALAFSLLVGLVALIKVGQARALFAGAFAVRRCFRIEPAPSTDVASVLVLPSVQAGGPNVSDASAPRMVAPATDSERPRGGSLRPATATRTRTIAGGIASEPPPPVAVASSSQPFAADAIETGYPAQASAKPAASSAPARRSTLFGVADPASTPHLTMPPGAEELKSDRPVDSSAASIDSSRRGDS
jgi:Glycosyl transferase family 2